MNMIARWNHGNGLIPVTLRGVDDLFRAVLDRMSTDFSPELMFDNGLSWRSARRPSPPVFRLPVADRKTLISKWSVTI